MILRGQIMIPGVFVGPPWSLKLQSSCQNKALLMNYKPKVCYHTTYFLPKTSPGSYLRRLFSYNREVAGIVRSSSSSVSRLKCFQKHILVYCLEYNIISRFKTDTEPKRSTAQISIHHPAAWVFIDQWGTVHCGCCRFSTFWPKGDATAPSLFFLWSCCANFKNILVFLLRRLPSF